MNAAGCKRFWMVVLVGFSQSLCLLLTAQETPTAAPVPAQTNTIISPKHVELPESLSMLSSQSPVKLFRELLAMNFVERHKALTNRSPESRKLILAKVREYESLKPDVRELRLRVTELRWYLWPLMNLPPAGRRALLQRVPAEDLPLVEDRLQEWDKLPAAVQKDLLANEATIRYFSELGAQSGQGAAGLSEARKKKLEAGIQQWQALPEEQRQIMVTRFNQFFGLTPQERAKALNTLSEPERRQLEKTLRRFGDLTEAQRAQCMSFFEKFASLSLEERQQFLKNADRWKLMTPDQRQSWRELVAKMPQASPLLAPHSRPHIVPRRPAPAVATNGG